MLSTRCGPTAEVFRRATPALTTCALVMPPRRAQSVCIQFDN